MVAEEGADKAQIEEQIKTMPNYFADYDTTVHFITEEELQRDHAGIPHGGFVLRTGKTGLNGEHNHVIEYSLKLDSNPEFTSCVIVTYARAAYRLYKEGQSGCKTVFDIAPAYLSAKDGAELRKSLLLLHNSLDGVKHVDFTNQGTLPLVSSCSGTKMPLMRHQVPADSNVPVLASQSNQIYIQFAIILFFCHRQIF